MLLKEYFYRTISYVDYLVKSKTKYYLHSPFVYQFYMNILAQKERDIAITHLRKALLQDDSIITFKDLGNEGIERKRSVSELCKIAAMSEKYGNVLSKSVHYFQPKTILELGTNIGIGSAYLAKGNPLTKVFTIEGSKELSDLAKENAAKLMLNNIHFIVGNFDEILQETLQSIPQIDFVFFDGNHKKEPTLQYFEQCLNHAHSNSIFVFDDIYWSIEMNEAWQAIKAHPKVKLSIDIYRMGFIFFKEEKLAKEHFRLLS